MTIGFRAAATAATAASTTLAITVPSSVQAGDVMLAFLSMYSDGTSAHTPPTTPPSGWTLLRIDEGVGTFNCKLGAYYRVAGGGDASSAVTWNLPDGATANRCAIVLVAYSGVDNSVPVHQQAANVSSGIGSTLTAPSVTTTVAGARIVEAFGMVPGSVNTITFTLPSTSRGQANDGQFVASGAADQAQGTAGSTGTQTATTSVSGAWSAQTIALAPGGAALSGTAVINFSTVGALATHPGHALSGTAAVGLSTSGALTTHPAHSLSGTATVGLGTAAVLTIHPGHLLSGTANVVVGATGVLTIPIAVRVTVSGARRRTGTVIGASITVFVHATGQRLRSGRAYTLIVSADGSVAGTFRRWTFVDPVDLSTYTFDVNPNAATTASGKRELTNTPTTARDGDPLSFQGETEVPVGEFSGSLLSKEQHDAFVAWWMKQRTILLIDDLGNEHHVLLVKYSPEQVKQRSVNKYRQKYTMQYLLMSEPA